MSPCKSLGTPIPVEAQFRLYRERLIDDGGHRCCDPISRSSARVVRQLWWQFHGGHERISALGPELRAHFCPYNSALNEAALFRAAFGGGFKTFFDQQKRTAFR